MSTTRKDVRNAITATARRFVQLREQWVTRDDLSDLVERTQAALTAATASLTGSQPTEVVREAQKTAGLLVAELEQALTQPPVEKAKATRARGPAKPAEVRELFRDDTAHLVVNWVLDPAAPRFVVVQLATEAGADDVELLIVKASRQWATEKKQALEFAARKVCEITGVEYVAPSEPAATRKRGTVTETRALVAERSDGSHPAVRTATRWWSMASRSSASRRPGTGGWSARRRSARPASW